MQDDTSGYDVVWSGGPGLTTYGAQRPGAVIQDVKEGDVAQWVELQRFNATHPRRVPGIDTDMFGYVTLYDTADTPQFVHRWMVERLAASWSRVLSYARYGGWPYCHLCGHAMPTYTGGIYRKVQRGHRLCETPRHRAVCQTCYVYYRMARGRWRGIDGFKAWRASRSVLTPEERAAHRRAASIASYRRRKAAMTPDQLTQRRATELARYYRQKAQRAAQATSPGPVGAQPDSR